MPGKGLEGGQHKHYHTTVLQVVQDSQHGSRPIRHGMYNLECSHDLLCQLKTIMGFVYINGNRMKMRVLFVFIIKSILFMVRNVASVSSAKSFWVLLILYSQYVTSAHFPRFLLVNSLSHSFSFSLILSFFFFWIGYCCSAN